MSLKGKVFLVTGGANGIGEKALQIFADEGCKIVLVDRDEVKGQQVISSLGKKTEALFIQADVSNEDDVQRYVSETLKAYGRIDVFFNNAGIEGRLNSLTELELDDFEQVLRVNLSGVFLGLKHVIRSMQQTGGGSIINTASVGGLRGAKKMGSYIASKHGVIGLTRVAALEGAPYGIRVNAICPASTQTRMIQSIGEQLNPLQPQLSVEHNLNAIPLGRYADPQEIGMVVKFLASEESSFITGAAIPIDGGRTVGV